VRPLGCAKFHLNRRRGWEYQKFPFLVKSRLAGANPLINISKICTGFYAPNYSTQLFEFDVIRFTVTALLLRNRASVN